MFITIFLSFIIFWSNSVARSIIAVNSYSLTVVVYFILTIVFVFAMPKVKANSLFGIRIPILYEYPELWARCQKNASIILSFTLIPQFLLIFYCHTVRFILTNILLVGSFINRNNLFWYNEIVHRCDFKNPDIIITGCQSATIPHNLFHTSYLTFPQYEFLVGINPDAVLLVVNSFDEINYIKNTIDFIESSIGTQVIGCIISPVQKNGVHCEFKNANDLSKILRKEVWEYKEITNKVFTAIINFFGGV